MPSERPRARDLGLQIGELQPGPRNALVDVPQFAVGHASVCTGTARTGVTALLPHGGNLFTERVAAAVEVINGYGKSVGLPQLAELGQLETPLLLTNTLSVWAVADAVARTVAEHNPGTRSVNPVVGECNDGALNDILGGHVTAAQVQEALSVASRDNVEEGNVGAGVGMTGFGWKAGIGTASRRLPGELSEYLLGALVLTNTGSAGDLRLDGAPIGRYLTPPQQPPPPGGSIIIVLATDAPLDSRQLHRVAKRAAFGLARVGGLAGHGSGDFALALSTGNRYTEAGEQRLRGPLVAETRLTGVFRAAVESVEEAIVNSLLRAETLTGYDGTVRQALPIAGLREVLKQYGRADGQAGALPCGGAEL